MTTSNDLVVESHRSICAWYFSPVTDQMASAWRLEYRNEWIEKHLGIFGGR